MSQKSTSRLMKISTGATGLVFAAYLLVGQGTRYLDQFWLEEAHQAYLSTLVEARNHAWGESVTVNVCAVNNQRECVDLASGNVVGWKAYVSDQAATTKTVSHHTFHAEFVDIQFNGMGANAVVGFDAEGYSLQPQVFAFEVVTVAKISTKNYTVVVEPSGAVQSLVNQNTDKLALAHVGTVSTPLEG